MRRYSADEFSEQFMHNTFAKCIDKRYEYFCETLIFNEHVEI